jgi:hypothetical protein
MRSKHVIEDDEDDTTPPAYDDGEEYKATKMLRVGRMALEL